MKKILIFSLMFFVLLSTIAVYATTENQETVFNIVTNVNVKDLVSSEENIEESEKTNLENFVSDDVYLISDNIVLNQEIKGNVYLIGEKIDLDSAIIEGNIFLIGEKVNLENSIINGSAYIIAQDFESNSQIRDLYLLGENLNMKNSSYITRSARLLGENLIISGKINNNCYISANEINIQKDAIIGGNLEYYSSKEANIKNENNIGNVEFHKQEEVVVEEDVKSGIDFFGNMYTFISSIIKAVIVGGLLVLVGNKTIKSNKNMTIASFCKYLGIGTVAFILLPIIAVMLMVTIVGFGIGLLVLVIYGLLIYVSPIVACLSLASTIVKDGSKIKIFGLTIGIYLGIKLLAIMAGVVNILTILLGLAGIGIAIKSLFYKEDNDKNSKVEVIENV